MDSGHGRSSAEGEGVTLDAPIAVPLDKASAATQLLELRRQMQEVQDALEAQKSVYIEKEEGFTRREDNLRNKDLELQEALVLFNKYLKQNENKRRKAQMAADSEKKQKEIKIKEILKKREEIRELRSECKNLEGKVKNNEKYKEFLQLVYSKHPEDFEERDHIMHRYWSLKKTQLELKEKQSRVEKETAELARRLKEEMKAQLTLSLELNNQYAKSSKAFEKILEKKSAEMQKIEHEESHEAARRMKLSSCIMSIENLYKRCCLNEASVLSKPPVLSHKMEEASGLEEKVRLTLKKLEVIHQYLEDFKSILDMWKMEKKEADRQTGKKRIDNGKE